MLGDQAVVRIKTGIQELQAKMLYHQCAGLINACKLCFIREDLVWIEEGQSNYAVVRASTSCQGWLHYAAALSLGSRPMTDS